MFKIPEPLLNLLDKQHVARLTIHNNVSAHKKTPDTILASEVNYSGVKILTQVVVWVRTDRLVKP